jgi:hypothetical protein
MAGRQTIRIYIARVMLGAFLDQLGSAKVEELWASIVSWET